MKRIREDGRERLTVETLYADRSGDDRLRVIAEDANDRVAFELDADQARWLRDNIDAALHEASTGKRP